MEPPCCFQEFGALRAGRHRNTCTIMQVCKRWQSILKNPGLGSELWREVIIDFGHELITAVHTPIAWSDRRPSDEEFRCALAGLDQLDIQPSALTQPGV